MNMKVTTLGLLVGAAALTLPSAPEAQANTVMIQGADANDPAPTRIRNGITVLKPSDEEHTPEQATFAFDPVNKAQGIVVMMNTGRLDGTAGPNLGDEILVGNIQGACMPLTLAQDTTTDSGLSLIPDTANFKYVSQRQSDENRAYHHPEIEALGNGYYAITANWDRDNNTNTERFLQVVDSQCNLQTLTGNVTLRGSGQGLPQNSSAEIMAKNNDNCSGRQAGGGGQSTINADGSVDMISAELCNGNGRDDGWANSITVTPAGPGVFNVNKNWDTSFIDQEERSRGACVVPEGGENLVVCCGTEGNNQPQREGVWCSGIDKVSGDSLWKERMAYRGETAEGQNTYAMRIKMLEEKTITGAGTGKVVMQWQMHRGNNNNNQKGGYDDKMEMAVASPTRAGMNAGVNHDLTDALIGAAVEMTHAVMIQTFTGSTEAPVPTIGFLSPNHNGGGGVNSAIMQVPLTAEGLAGAVSVRNMAGPIDSQKYAKYLGNNPNNQGRNFTDCHTIPNPFVAGPVGAKTTGVGVINLCAMTGKLTSATIPSMKPDLFFEIWTSLEVPEAPGQEPGETDPNPDPSNPDPSNPTNPPGNGNDGFSSSSGGCSTTGGSTGGLSFLLLGLALIAIRRRRSL